MSVAYIVIMVSLWMLFARVAAPRVFFSVRAPGQGGLRKVSVLGIF